MRISDWSSDVCSSDLPLDMQAFVDAALRAARRHGSLTIRDGGGEGGGAVLYSDAEDPVANGHDSGDIFSRTLSLDVYGRSWELDFSADMQAALAERTPELRMTLVRSEEHTSELQSLMRISYAVFCLKKKKTTMKGEIPA